MGNHQRLAASHQVGVAVAVIVVVVRIDDEAQCAAIEDVEGFRDGIGELGPLIVDDEDAVRPDGDGRWLRACRCYRLPGG